MKRSSLTWGVVLALGAALRGLAAFPSFRHPLQSDSTMTGLTAFEILRGDLQVFLFDGTRLGALESYLHVPVFALLGASRATLHLAPLLAGIALLVVFAALARELLGPREGLVALLFLAVPSPMVLLWNILPFGYTETLLWITAVLASAVRIARRGPDPLSVLGFGLAAGLGWWCSALSLAGTLPAALWIVLHRPGLVRSWRFHALATAGIVVGALPWLAINLRYSWISFQEGPAWQSNFAFRTVGGPEQLLSNAGRFAGEILPGLLLRAECPRPSAVSPMIWIAGALHAAALLFAFVQVFSPGSWRGPAEKGGRRVPPLLLPLLVAGCTAGFFVVSAAGSIPGDVVRYILPIGLAAPLLLASLGMGIAARSRALAALLLLALLGVHVSGFCLPWQSERVAQRRLARAEDRLLEALTAQRVEWVFGPYWDVYGLNFLSGETIRALPEFPGTDYHGYERKLGPAAVPFALVSREPGQVTALARRAGLSGEAMEMDGFEVFFAAPTPPVAPAEQAALLRKLLLAPLPPEALRARVELLEGGEAGLSLEPGGRREVAIRVAHTGRGTPWTTNLGRPAAGTVRVGIRWFRDGAVQAEQRASLPRSLSPGDAAEIELRLEARGRDGQPLSPGRYEVRIGLVQELVQWFKDEAVLQVTVE